MKKVKLLLEPAEVEMIRDALQICYDDDCLEDDDMLEGLCQAFGILTMSGNFVKVKVDENTHYEDECDCIGNCACDDGVDESTVLEDDECHCDECRADRGLPPLVNEDEDDVDPDAVDPNDSCWDTDEDDNEDDDTFCYECGNEVCRCHAETKPNLKDVWNANEAWSTDKKVAPVKEWSCDIDDPDQDGNTGPFSLK